MHMGILCVRLYPYNLIIVLLHLCDVGISGLIDELKIDRKTLVMLCLIDRYMRCTELRIYSESKQDMLQLRGQKFYVELFIIKWDIRGTHIIINMICWWSTICKWWRHIMRQNVAIHAWLWCFPNCQQLVKYCGSESDLKSIKRSIKLFLPGNFIDTVL